MVQQTLPEVLQYNTEVTVLHLRFDNIYMSSDLHPSLFISISWDFYFSLLFIVGL